MHKRCEYAVLIFPVAKVFRSVRASEVSVSSKRKPGQAFNVTRV